MNLRIPLRPAQGHARSGARRGPIEILLGLLFVGAGAGIMWLGFRNVALELGACAWPETPCTVVSSESRDEPGGRYHVTVEYRYEAGGAVRTSSQWNVYGGTFNVDSIAERDAILARYPEGAAATCRVDPRDPSRAVLSAERRHAFANLALVFFGAVFAMAGLAAAGLLRLGRGRGRRRGGSGAADRASDSGYLRDERGRTPGRGPRRRPVAPETLIAGGVGLAFVAAGAVTLVVIVRGIREKREALSWPIVEGTVLRSEAKESHSDRGTSYTHYLSWSYEAGGARHEGDNRALRGPYRSYSRWSDVSRRIAEHPAGSALRLHVDPEDPGHAVPVGLPPSPQDYALLLFPAGFLFFGSLALGVCRRESRRRRGPHVRFDLPAGSFGPGEGAEATWELEERDAALRLLSLRIALRGTRTLPSRRKAGRPHGVEPRERREIVHAEELYATTDPYEMQGGAVDFRIPETLPGGADPYALDWHLLATGDVAGGGPPMHDEFAL